MASTSCVSNMPLPATTMTWNSHQNPAPLAKYEEVTTNPKLFMSTLEKLHADMGTKFMIPIIGGKELDLFHLFIEVTSRGGIEKIIKERRWKEVTQTFNFPSTATNASFVLRKYYSSLLYHYEQIYYFRAATGWNPTLTASSTADVVQRAQFSQPCLGFQHSRVDATAESSQGSAAVVGVIDAKFESGYLITVSIGSEVLKGVLYQDPHPHPHPQGAFQSVMAKNTNNNCNSSLGVVHRRRRRKKSEIKRRDPAHPKPNRSGYNFFFAEQHARLKPLHQAKDREISRIIGELWNKLKDPERLVYQEKALKDKERYKAEMEDYRQKRNNNNNAAMLPLQQQLPEMDENEEGSLQSQTPEEESTSGGSENENDINMDASLPLPPVTTTTLPPQPTFFSLDKPSMEGDYNLGHQNIHDSKNMLTML
ncbi:hypothetical protein HN51_068278 [Arachis hypogaea]|uniref:High mobility group B protein n=1 Tax=Arachis hypogaea TaxID=3818 RepID=A0A445D9V7_ARAHY|nr:high mobility group B protein 15-like [Arachis ipaensis]XP_025650609.1 high mobility group B protein 15-like [Arachis hypogaea]XP_025697347.1 high mobility group B protein 15-like [Arachis hypogaea]QHO09672.1 High mobility group B protein [Arachis hypogaea]RYR59936.1 hypothetical protein Ahy_A04g017065 [Arachis hypogaea]